MRPRAAPRGSTLVIALIMLAVLSVIGAAAVLLSSQERRNASAMSRVDQLTACAQAARAKIWAEIARYGPRYLSSDDLLTTPLEISGIGKLQAPAHYGSTEAMKVNEVVLAVEKAVSDGAPTPVVDLTNRTASPDALTSGRAYRVVARCTDAQNRELEVEFAMRFALF
ncbi:MULTISPECIES: pilus assembly PilX N-terminal domain-containing protein [unclassified Anaeromyxobacter]|uniref:pilus assembly PilX N-terminal domain-containing protein n=1 Tax=unclassified Anaeromyxobacter TaxID=2620896 RepID=UPI001F5ACA4B|nr:MULTISPECIES: pilus assembly PilX N-terminal domain-containing protein [unclassified Anaeromyxobacter]